MSKKLKEIAAQLESCNFECEAGLLVNNTSFIELKQITEREEPPFDELIQQHIEFALPTFAVATSFSSISKLKWETYELLEALRCRETFGDHALLLEYIDCMMCLVDSAARAGFTTNQIKAAFAFKLNKNKERKWQRNDDNTYSHVK